MVEKSWFEMRDQIRRRLADAVWIPLKAWTETRTGQYGHLDYQNELLGVHSLAVDIGQREEGEQLTWSSSWHTGIYIHDGSYKPAEVYQARLGTDLGVALVLAQHFDGAERGVWHLNQDLVFALKLMREGDVWVCPSDGYEEVVRLSRNADGREAAISIRAEYLRDYLAARKMALRIASYRSRSAILEDCSSMGWKDEPIAEEVQGGRFEGRAWDIHEGGHRFGSEVSVFHVSRTDVDLEAEVPIMGNPTDEGTKSDQWTERRHGRRLCSVQGEFWRDEWVEPAAVSARVRGDHVPSSTSFSVDGAGTRMSADALDSEDIGRWLWFSPALIPAILARRGGELDWYTRHTGNIGIASGGTVHFGVNEVGLINVYAYDVARLNEWERRLWAGFNVIPDGGVSAELTASQVHATPAETSAPERHLAEALDTLNLAFEGRYGTALIKAQDQRGRIIAQTHRFRAADLPSLLALAKDVARLTADSFDATAIREALKLPSAEKVGTLKGLERLLSTLILPDRAHELIGPLFGVYELRLGDAHLPSSKIDEALELARIDRTAPWPHQGLELLHVTVSVLFTAADILANA